MALIASRFAQAKGMKLVNGQDVSIRDFLLHGIEEDEDKEGSPEDIFNLLKNIATKE